ncbi:trigger factor [Rhodobacteraceae bacterium CCMM004]|nr:trigger factor [Rhodobacteraceae bacterium CCMM004]
MAGLEGRWRLSRRIDDRAGDQSGRLSGTATWTRDGDLWRQDEAGTLHLGAAPPLTATRSYLWRADGARVAVAFADGRPFHAFDPARPTARHDCAPDVYRVAYDLADPDDWTAVWEVRGPRKDYTMTSCYTRP